MTAKFNLELYITHESDRAFSDREKTKLTNLVKRIAPHIDLEVHVLIATDVVCSGLDQENSDYMQFHRPSRNGYQSLLITNKFLGPGDVQGRAFIDGNIRAGCIIKPRMEKKIDRGGHSEDVTIHEWIHTIFGMKINGRKIPDPHTLTNGYKCDSDKAPDGDDQWYDWYGYLLRESD
ncbi:MAG: hypothetical protein HZA15_11660 [Nitrospirae bacterium]|nr:hypothetical protein [Nitrospirota bacterium]